MGVSDGDLIMVHASLRAIGPVVGGADGLLDTLGHAVGTEGTLLMTLGATDEMAWVNERPEAERARLLAGSEPFDHLLTPADPDVGVLAEVFRGRASVSDHPEGRFGAWGRLEGHLVDDVPWHDYYGPGSPLERLVRADGKVLRLGADPDTVTLTHYAEALADVPVKRRVRRHRLVRGSAGPEVVVVDTLDDSDGIVEYPGEDYFIEILRDYLATGRARRGKVGNADSELLEAADYVTFSVAWMEEHLAGADHSLRPDTAS